MSLRARLALVATTAVAVTVVLASLVVYFLVRGELRGQIDRSLHQQAIQIPTLPGAPFRNYISKGQYAIHVRGDPFGGLWQLIDTGGNTYRPEEFDTLPPLLPGAERAVLVAKGTVKPYYWDTTLKGTHLRIYTMRYAPPAVSGQPAQSPIAIEVSAQLSPVDRELEKIRLWLILVALGGVGIASVAGFLVARASLRPVRKLSDTAERVRATRDLSQRIEVEGNDELSRLALTFNAMLESLDQASQRQQQLVQDASHELRTPLTSLRTNIEVLAKGDELPAHEREQLLHDVVGQLGEMTELIAELTELAQGEEQVSGLEDVRLDLLTEEAIRRTLRNHPDVPIESDLEATTIVGVPASLERAIANLLDNAAKWSPSGRSVEVRLADHELTVRDHGPGIAEDDVPHIFERFYRATSARSMPGSGLGLAIVQRVAEAHGGEVSVEPAPGGGTVMRLRLLDRELPTDQQFLNGQL